MKTSYIAIAALGLAAAVLFNVRYGKHEKQVLPSYPVPSEPARQEASELPPLPSIPKAAFPEINPPPDGALVIPASSPIISLPPIPASGGSPAPELIQIPVASQPLPQGSSTGVASSTPATRTPDQAPSSPTVPGVPTVPLPPTAPSTQPMSPPPPITANPNNSTAPNPLQAPNPPVPVGKQTIATRGFYDSAGNISGSPKPPPSMEPTGSSTTFTPHGKFVVLKGKEIAANTDEYKKMIGEIM
ncbi:MAG TPA: hypothetical protein VG097_05985, partial [Gemmata sp.]|nr:hypothetical protein [Gemmata sp.]